MSITATLSRSFEIERLASADAHKHCLSPVLSVAHKLVRLDFKLNMIPNDSRPDRKDKMGVFLKYDGGPQNQIQLEIELFVAAQGKLLPCLSLKSLSFSVGDCWGTHQVLPRSIEALTKRGCLSYNNKLLTVLNVSVSLRPVLRPCLHSGSVPGQSKELEQKEMAGTEIVGKLLSYVWPKDNHRVRLRVVTSLALLLSAKGVNVSVPFFFKGAVDHFNALSGDALALNAPVSSVLTVGGSLIVGYGLARAGQSLFREMQNAVFARVAQHSMRNIARTVFLHLHHLDMQFHLSRQTGALAKAIDRGIKGIDQVLRFLVFNIVPTGFEVLMVVAIMWNKCGAPFAYVTIATVLVYTIGTALVTRWRTDIRKEMNQADNRASNHALDSLINYETVKYHNNEKHEADAYDRILAKYERASLKTSSSLALLNFGQNALMSASLATLMLMVANGIQRGVMTVGDMVMVNGLLFQVSVPLGFLGSTMREIRLGLVDMRTMFGLLDQKSAIVSKENAPPACLDDLSKPAIKFENVTFGYTERQNVLDGLSFEVPHGHKVAIVGGSGSGKSTVVRLLFRFYDPAKGRISLGGQYVDDIDLYSLRDAIGIVPQDIVLFHNTIFYNIQYGNVNASREAVYEAAKLADLHESVLKMPLGYDTIVGERGLKLSGGEKQRVAIARVILKNPPIFVYDEATSSLDALTEQTILESLRRTVRNRTSLYIAHRLATIEDADTILVLDNGRVKEMGSHKELMARGEKYAELWRSQHRYSSAIDEMEHSDKEKEAEIERALLSIGKSNCCGGGCK